MTESVRKRNSKWDIKADSYPPTEGIHEIAWCGKVDGSIPDKNTKSEKDSGSHDPKWDNAEANNDTESKDTSIPDKDTKSEKSSGSRDPKWDNAEANNDTKSKDMSGWDNAKTNNDTKSKDKFGWDNAETNNDTKSKDKVGWDNAEANNDTKSKDKSGWDNAETNNDTKSKDKPVWSRWESMSGSGGAQKDENIDTAWGRDQTYCSSMSPGMDTWRQQSYSRSPKRSRSRSYRSRSRSPPHGSKRSEGWNEQNRRAPGNSAPTSKDNRDYEGRRQSESGASESWLNRRERGGSSRHGNAEEGSDFSRRNYYGHDKEQQEYPRNNMSNNRCFDFTKGRCTRGDSCRYAHHDASTDGRDNRGGFGRLGNIPCRFFPYGKCRNGESCKFSHEGPMNVSNEGSSQDNNNSWGAPNLDNESKSWGGPKRNETTGVSDVAKVTGWSPRGQKMAAPKWTSENNGLNRGVPPETSGSLKPEQYLQYNDSGSGHISQAPNEMTLQTHQQNMSQEVFGQAQHANLSANILHIPPVPGQYFNGNGQSEPLLVSHPQSGHGFDLNVQAQQQITTELPSNSQTQNLFHDKNSESGTPQTQNLVTSEKVAKITNISASLAQIFGNGQQLPQLYAALNPTKVPGLAPVPVPVPPPAPVEQVNQATAWSQKHYDLNRPDINNPPPEFPWNNPPIVEQINNTVAGVPSSVNVGSIGGGGGGGGGPKEEDKNGSHEGRKKLEPVVDREAKEKKETVGYPSNKGQESRHPEVDMEIDDADEDGKRSKDVKGMRMFKFALVESVKEILKPTWKEGQMSKEAHKTIVKKVVDKVTGTLQGANVPQTQEKIDSYLSYSKPKLTKLVQGYVEKYLKC